jgi:hypothetical protein
LGKNRKRDTSQQPTGRSGKHPSHQPCGSSEVAANAKRKQKQRKRVSEQAAAAARPNDWLVDYFSSQPARCHNAGAEEATKRAGRKGNVFHERQGTLLPTKTTAQGQRRVVQACPL